ncbi:hypothetical protein WN944_022999 [Citrus x changshan-huyou]|uniref:Uncharacterized protein n=1 Tax=Citrus x changshan-huyou TaxID=2935761 RepID=A0AAP0N2F0_9ROSI
MSLLLTLVLDCCPSASACPKNSSASFAYFAVVPSHGNDTTQKSNQTGFGNTDVDWGQAVAEQLFNDLSGHNLIVNG